VSAPRLAVLERRFLRLIAQPAALDAAARELTELDPGASPLSGWLRGSESFVSSRLGIYAHMYYARLRDSLRQDYPKLAVVLGTKAFARLALEYLVDNPSDHPSLRYHGRHLARWLERGACSVSARDDLAALARLEWARIEVFDAAEAAPLDAEQLAAYPVAHWPSLRLQRVPACAAVETNFAVAALWSAADGDEPLPEVTDERETLLVWRRGFRVYHRPLQRAEAALLERLATSATLSELCEAAAEMTGGDAATKVLGWLRQWLADELLCLADSDTREPHPPLPRATRYR
jgi:hypothetical protein